MYSETKTCQNCKQPFTIEPDDFAFYEKIHVPPPTWCPRCRLIRRLAWRGNRILYKQACDFTGDTVITILHPDAHKKVYRQDVWWSDKWDPKSYGREYDFSRPFFTQFGELLREVPLPALYTEYTTLVQSDYCNAAASLKNCYLCFNADTSDNCAYLNMIEGMKDSFDVSFSNFCELSYGSVSINKCYATLYSQDCEECNNVWFSKDLVGCSNCFGCIGLRNKSYCVFNEQKTKEEYQKTVRNFDLGSARQVARLKEEVLKFMLKFPRKELHGRKNAGSSGDYLLNCKNVRDSFMVSNSEDLRYCQLLKAGPSAQSYDYTMFDMKAEWIYDSCWVGINVSNVKFSFWDYTCHDLEYCIGCHGSGNLFGCVGIRTGEYCVLNKSYSKEEYGVLVSKIKEQMKRVPYRDKLEREYCYGEFFPPEFSPWRYNETNAYEWFSLTKDEALRQGFSWRDPDAREYRDATIVLPDHIKDVPDTITKEILKCEACGKNYQIIPMELQFLRRFTLPIPRQCPLCRDRARIRQMNPMETHDRACAKCGQPIKTSYGPDRPEIVYCEECYRAEVV